MMVTRQRGAYPLATQDSQAVPLDIIYPLGLIVKAVAETESFFNMPALTVVAAFTATKDTIVRAGSSYGTPADGAVVADAMFIPAGATMTIEVIEDTYYATSLDGDGFLYVQLVDQWAALGLSLQYVRK